jgi:penicillin-binding protein 2
MTPVAPIADPPIAGIADSSWDLVLQAMHEVTTCQDSPLFGHTCGTGAGAFKGAAYQAAGKTGTAQVYTVARSQRLTEHVAEQLRDHAWFIAFAPVDKPRIAVAVLVEHAGFGAQAAAPIARKVIDAYLLRQFTPTPPAGSAAQPNSTATPGAPHAAEHPPAHAPHPTPDNPL